MLLRKLTELKKQYDQALSDGDIKKALHIKLQIEDIEGERHVTFTEQKI